MGRDKLHVAKARAAIGAGGERAAAAALVLEKHEKVMHMQVVQAAEGTPVRVACTSDADMHLLGTLEAGETLDIVCPPGCEWQAWVVKQMKNNTAVWGGTTGYASRSLVCVAGFQETGSHAGGPYRVLITHNDKGSAGREIHGVTSLDWTESGFGYLIYNLAGLDEEEKRMLDETLADQVYYVKPPPTRGVQRERNELEHSTLEASAADDAHVNVSDSDLEDLHSYYNDEL